MKLLIGLLAAAALVSAQPPPSSDILNSIINFDPSAQTLKHQQAEAEAARARAEADLAHAEADRARAQSDAIRAETAKRIQPQPQPIGEQVPMLTVARYLQVKDDRDGSLRKGMYMNWLSGLGTGIVVANLAQSVDGKPLFCEPKTLTLNLDNYQDILNRSIETYRGVAEKGTLFVPLLLLDGLKQTFPCSKAEGK